MGHFNKDKRLDSTKETAGQLVMEQILIRSSNENNILKLP